MKQINSFSGKYDFLSNFYKSPFKANVSNLDFNIFRNINLIEFPTVEHFYQAFKATNRSDFINIIMAKTPGIAKRMGRKIKIREDFEDIKLKAMYTGVFLKFAQNENLKLKLIKTDNLELIEGNYWHDNFWGRCTCDKCKDIEGKNKLGLILMSLRKFFIKNIL